MKKKMTLWLLALLLLLTGCGATGGTEPTLQNSSDAIVSEDADQLRSTSGINVEMHISNIQKSRDFDMLIR